MNNKETQFYVLLLITIIASAFSIYIFLNRQSSTAENQYYKQLYEIEAAKVKRSEVVIDSLQKVKEAAIANAEMHLNNLRSTLIKSAAIGKNKTELKQQYEKDIISILNLSTMQLDSFYAAKRNIH